MLNLFPLPAETIPTTLGPPWINPKVHLSRVSFDLPMGKCDSDYKKRRAQAVEAATSDPSPPPPHLLLFTNRSMSGPEPLDCRTGYAVIVYRGGEEVDTIAGPLDFPLVAGDAETAAILTTLEELLNPDVIISLSRTHTSCVTILSDCLPVLRQIQSPTTSL
ncbi:hypothetical protein EW145_g5866 [Phellinidium pouzarii]|uniref:Uncharacterized protein n=1 Tax=Phellinidium pouzarii TaxID=167371 RepID=A0A4S4KYH1_9AGAM|nr:hypothetical protein EW145_g5866 [Phellinidium pouzarii]